MTPNRIHRHEGLARELGAACAENIAVMCQALLWLDSQDPQAPDNPEKADAQFVRAAASARAQLDCMREMILDLEACAEGQSL